MGTNSLYHLSPWLRASGRSARSVSAMIDFTDTTVERVSMDSGAQEATEMQSMFEIASAYTSIE